MAACGELHVGSMACAMVRPARLSDGVGYRRVLLDSWSPLLIPDTSGAAMTSVRFGLIMPAESRDQRWRATYVDDLTRFLDRGTGHFDSAWIVDHLQSGDADLLEGFSTLAYMAA